MTTEEWLGCDLLESVPGKVSGAVVFKETRLPVETITQNVDAFVEGDGLSLDEAIVETLLCFPGVPGGQPLSARFWPIGRPTSRSATVTK